MTEFKIPLIPLSNRGKRKECLVLLTSLMVIAGVILGCAAGLQPPLEVVPAVDLSRYAGRWYEIASFPTWFQKGCVGSTAEYSLRPDGGIDVLNQCRKAPDGAVDSAKGKAWVTDPATNAKLKVQFFWPFRGDYWIIDLGRDYDYAVVGHPSRDYLWILSRTPQMDAGSYERVLERVRQKGYDVSRLVKTVQPG
jgi:apolipoprotein D and lipocalin family protein